MSLFSLSVEQLTLSQPIKVYFDDSRPEAVIFCTLVSNARYMMAVACKQQLLEFGPVEMMPEGLRTVITPDLSLITFFALMKSSFKNTIKRGMTEQQFGEQFEERLKRLK